MQRGKSFASVSRNNVFEDMIKLYKKRGITSKDINIIFTDEDAVGDGVTKDVFTCFYLELYNLFDGENKKVAPVQMEEETLLVIGQIISHSYICPTVVGYHLFDVRNHKDMVQSFLNYLPTREAEIIESFANGHR